MVRAIHQRQIAEHGGTDGIRDEELLESALARPQNLFACGENIDMASLAAAYAFELAKNHAFVDGNKRTALVVARTFLALNGIAFVAAAAEKYEMMDGLAQGSVSEEQFASWIRSHSDHV